MVLRKRYIHAVSLTPDLEEFLKSDENLSLSAIIQNRLKEIKKYQDECDGCPKLRMIIQHRANLLKFIEENGLSDKLIEWSKGK